MDYSQFKRYLTAGKHMAALLALSIEVLVIAGGLIALFGAIMDWQIASLRIAIGILYIVHGLTSFPYPKEDREKIGLAVGCVAFFVSGVISLIISSWWPLPTGAALGYGLALLLTQETSRGMLVMLAGNLIKFAVPMGFFIWSIFNPAIAGYAFLSITVLYVGYLFFTDISGKPNPDPSLWTPDEAYILRKYHLALRFPFGAKDMSCYLNGIRWSSVIWVPWLVWNHLWIPAISLVIIFFLTGSLSVRLDPFFFLSEALRRGKHEFYAELSLLHEVAEKLRPGL